MGEKKFQSERTTSRSMAKRRPALIKPLPLRLNFAWTFVGNIVYTISQWGMLVVLAKLGSPAAVGQFTLGLAVGAPVIAFTNLSLSQAQAVDAKDEFQFFDYLTLRVISTSIAVSVIIGVVSVAGYRQETAHVVLAVGVAKAVEAMSDICYGFYQKREMMDRIAKSMMLRGPLSLTALALGLYLTGQVFWGCLGMAISWLVILLIYDSRGILMVLREEGKSMAPGKPHLRQFFRVRKRSNWRQDPLVQLTILTLPLAFSATLQSLKTNIPRHFIEYHFGEELLGIYAALSYLTISGGVIIIALGKSASSRLAQYYQKPNAPAFRKLMMQLVGIAALLGVLGIFVSLIAGEFLLTVFYSTEYAQHRILFVWIMLSGAVGYIASALGFGMTASHNYGIQPVILLGVVLSSAGLCYFLIPTYGMLGAVWANLIASIFMMCAALMVNLYASSNMCNHTETSSK